jgi:VanZ family protein
MYSSVIPAPSGTPIIPWEPALLPFDKWMHFIGYATLSLLLAYAIIDWDVPHHHQALLVLITIVTYGVGIEAIQLHLPYRSFSLSDIYANTLGAIIVLPWYAVRPYFEFHQRNTESDSH